MSDIASPALTRTRKIESIRKLRDKHIETCASVLNSLEESTFDKVCKLKNIKKVADTSKSNTISNHLNNLDAGEMGQFCLYLRQSKLCSGVYKNMFPTTPRKRKAIPETTPIVSNKKVPQLIGQALYQIMYGKHRIQMKR